LRALDARIQNTYERVRERKNPRLSRFVQRRPERRDRQAKPPCFQVVPYRRIGARES
jgi:hypothetical protein